MMQFSWTPLAKVFLEANVKPFAGLYFPSDAQPGGLYPSKHVVVLSDSISCTGDSPHGYRTECLQGIQVCECIRKPFKGKDNLF